MQSMSGNKPKMNTERFCVLVVSSQTPSVYNMIMLISNIIEYGETASNALKRTIHRISEYIGDPNI